MKVKCLLAIVASAATAISAYAQGNVAFANNSSTAVRLPGGTAAPAGSLRVGLFYSTDTSAFVDPDAPADALTLLEPTVLTGPFAGIFGGGTRDIPGTSPGQTVLLQVRAWSPSFATYADALQSGDSSALRGNSNVMMVDLGGGQLPTPSLVIQGGLQGFTVMPVPEPSLLALGLLGVIGLFGARRIRK